jgi:hypothetical protein
VPGGRDIVHVKGAWRKRHNHEIELSKEPDVTKYIKINTFISAAYMRNIRAVKKVFYNRPEWSRNIGRLRLRLEEIVIQDIGL